MPEPLTALSAKALRASPIPIMTSNLIIIAAATLAGCIALYGIRRGIPAAIAIMATLAIAWIATAATLAL